MAGEMLSYSDDYKHNIISYTTFIDFNDFNLTAGCMAILTAKLLDEFGEPIFRNPETGAAYYKGYGCIISTVYYKNNVMMTVFRK